MTATTSLSETMTDDSNESFSTLKKPQLVFMFDFDHTLVDENTDTFIYEGLMPELHSFMKELRHSGVSWTETMRRIFEKLLTRFRIEQLTERMEQCPMSEKTVECLKEIKKHGCEVNIISDSNEYFIGTILRKQGVEDCVTHIHTNTIKMDNEKNTIDITEYSIAYGKPHDCKTCPANMCKGEIVLEIVNHHLGPSSEHNENVIFIYCGDGKNDFCPLKHLRDCDTVLVRKGFSLEKLVTTNGSDLICNIEYWQDYGELYQSIMTKLKVLEEKMNNN
nr:unnamed protein product [Naegleria fowleri]